MRYLCFLIVILYNVCCKTTEDDRLISIKKTLKTECPKDGTCSFEVLKNKNIKLRYDKFGASYPNIYDANKLLLKFEYKRDTILSNEDSSYRELIYIAVDFNNLDFEKVSINNINVYFARLCFCRGQTGYYKIKEGEMVIKKLSDQTYQLKLDFKTDEVPQVIRSINETFSLKN